MFTGLVEELGRLDRLERHGDDARLIVRCSFPGLTLGESVAVDGACLTVDERLDGAFAARASAETLRRTTLGSLGSGQPVHLERALAVGARLGGHIVTGHVDAVARIRDRAPRGQALRLGVELPPALAPLVAEKGSVAIDGVSLTVNDVATDAFWVMLVPFTRSETHLDRKRPGDTVNLETDVLAKYVARLLHLGGAHPDPRAENRPAAGDEGRGVSLDLLTRQGFLR